MNLAQVRGRQRLPAPVEDRHTSRRPAPNDDAIHSMFATGPPLMPQRSRSRVRRIAERWFVKIGSSDQAAANRPPNAASP